MREFCEDLTQPTHQDYKNWQVCDNIRIHQRFLQNLRIANIENPYKILKFYGDFKENYVKIEWKIGRLLVIWRFSEDSTKPTHQMYKKLRIIENMKISRRFHGTYAAVVCKWGKIWTTEDFDTKYEKYESYVAVVCTMGR